MNAAPDQDDDFQLMQQGFRYALSLTHDQHDAEDLAQQACLRALKRLGRLPDKPYLLVTIRNLFFDQVRRRRHATHQPLQEQSIADSSPSVTKVVERRSEVDDALRVLRPVEREAIYLHCMEGYTAAEIASLTGQPRGTVLSLLSRAKRRIAHRHQDAAVRTP